MSMCSRFMPKPVKLDLQTHKYLESVSPEECFKYIYINVKSVCMCMFLIDIQITQWILTNFCRHDLSMPTKVCQKKESSESVNPGGE